jgi:hypothetical protein
MPILAGMLAVFQVAARWTLGDMPAQRRSATLFDGLHGCQVV